MISPKDSAKHVLRALKANARLGFWNGSLPPLITASSRTRHVGPDGRQEHHRSISTADASSPATAGSPHHGIEGGLAQNPCRWCGRSIDYARRSQFCSEVAEREGFEPSKGF